jgi:hypothetical protein
MAIFAEEWRKAREAAIAEDAEGVRLLDNYARAMDLYRQMEALSSQYDPEIVSYEERVALVERDDALGWEAWDLLMEIKKSSATGRRAGMAKLRAAAYLFDPSEDRDMIGEFIKGALAALEGAAMRTAPCWGPSAIMSRRSAPQRRRTRTARNARRRGSAMKRWDASCSKRQQRASSARRSSCGCSTALRVSSITSTRLERLATRYAARRSSPRSRRFSHA